MLLAAGVAAGATALAARAPSIPMQDARPWANDPAWFEGKAEWALYEATRTIYGRSRSYEATIFTNRQKMDPSTTTKAGDAMGGNSGVDVFKHNVSEVVPAENYDYRFLTTSFVRAGDMTPFSLIASTQEDCGATFHRFVVTGGEVIAREFSYFPDEGQANATYDAPSDLAFHDMLTLTLRNYPFDEPRDLAMPLIADQTDTHSVRQTPTTARVTYVGRETLRVPYGEVDAHHLRVTHAPMGGTTTSDYWFADDHRHVLVQCEGPYGVTYRLKRLDWWAYWADPRP